MSEIFAGSVHEGNRLYIIRKSFQPGWRNWQTQRTQNPPRATSWGFDPPSRHQLFPPESFSSIDIGCASGSVNGCNWVSYWVVPDVLEQTRQYLLDAQKLLSGKPTPLEFYDQMIAPIRSESLLDRCGQALALLGKVSVLLISSVRANQLRSPASCAGRVTGR